MLSSSPRSDSSDATASFKLYHYDPNRGAAGAFVALFILCTIVHLYKLVRGRTWFFIPFIIGLACKRVTIFLPASSPLLLKVTDPAYFS
jgi:hypothetical protein